MGDKAQQGTTIEFLNMVARPQALAALAGACIAYMAQRKLLVAIGSLGALDGTPKRIVVAVLGLALSAIIMAALFALARALASPAPRLAPLTGRFAHVAFVYLMIVTLIFSALGEQGVRLQMEYGLPMKQILLINAAVGLFLKIALFPVLVLLAALAAGTGEYTVRTMASRLSGPQWMHWFGYSALLAVLGFTGLLLTFRMMDAPDAISVTTRLIVESAALAIQAIFGALWAILSYRSIADQF